MPDCIIKDTGDGSDIEMGGAVSQNPKEFQPWKKTKTSRTINILLVKDFRIKLRRYNGLLTVREKLFSLQGRHVKQANLL
jgi:hypothetical protein